MPQKSLPKTPKTQHHLRSFLLVLIVVGVFVLAGFFTRQIYLFASDVVANLTYDTSDEVDNITDEIGLTNYGRFLFGGAKPSVETHTDFNAHCESYNYEVSTLGCYHNGRIYIYDVDAADLAGIKQSTAAHELMHAVWAHLTSFERNRLTESILEVYHDEKYAAELSSQLETYSEDELVEELHSRLATEVKTLPEALESHYAKYFVDQDALVEFYESYRQPFEKLDAEFRELAADLSTLQDELDALQEEYAERSEKLEQDIAEFNQCADTIGCFTSDYAFNSRRQELVTEQSELEDLYLELSNIVAEYNEKVDAYNSNILRGEELDSKMNSNSKTKGELNDN